MALPTLATTQATVELVCTLDPCVTAPDGVCGWAPKSGCTVAAGADVVTVRPLNRDERWQIHDAGQMWRQADVALRLGVVATNGDRDPEAVEAWRSALADDEAQYFLARYIRDVSEGKDPVKAQSRWLHIRGAATFPVAKPAGG